MRFYLFRFLIFLTLLSSCLCSQMELTDSEKQWMNCYDLNQRLIFKSNFGNYDTFTVTEKRNFYSDCNPIEVSTVKDHTMSATLTPNKCPDPDYCDAEIIITKNKKACVFPFIRIFGLEYSPDIQSQHLQMTKTTLATTGKTYDSCYVFESGVLAQSAGNNYLSSFSWNKHEGLIQYITNKNEVFALFKKGYR